MAPEKAAAHTGRSLRTVTRWIATGINDLACLTLLQSITYGLIPHADWQDWYVTDTGHLTHRQASRQ